MCLRASVVDLSETRGCQEPTLQHLEVLNVCIFRVDVELDSGHGDVHVYAVKDLAECGTVDG